MKLFNTAPHFNFRRVLCSVVLLSVFFVVQPSSSHAQTTVIDSLNSLLANEKIDSNKVMLMWQLVQEYEVNKPDTAYSIAQRALNLAKKIGYLEGESRTLVSIANYFSLIGDYPRALENYIEKIKIEEKRNIPEKLASANVSLSILYASMEQYKDALMYGKRADSIIAKFKIEKWLVYSLLNLGDIYYRIRNLDSALHYTNKVMSIAIEKKDNRFIGTSYNNLGNIYAAKGDSVRALENYYKALPILKEEKDDDFICETTLGMARVYDKMNRADSATYFAHSTLNLALQDSFQTRVLDAYIFFVDRFKRLQNIDSAFHYQNLMLQLKEQISSKERIRETQILSMDENLRQRELAEQRVKDKQELDQRLQLLLIGITIPIIFLITLFLSRRQINVRVIRFLGHISLLLLFEYLTLLLHPRVIEIAHHKPVVELFIFVCIAAILIPAHHKIQHWVITKLTERKQQLDVAAAEASAEPTALEDNNSETGNTAVEIKNEPGDEATEHVV